MEMTRFGKSVIRVVRLDKDGGGCYTPVTLYEKPEGKKKKGSLLLRKVDKHNMRLVKAQHAFLDSYTSRHDESNRKKKDGWLVDLVPNVVESGRTAGKKLKIRRLLNA
jgi:hypothetical protein